MDIKKGILTFLVAAMAATPTLAAQRSAESMYQDARRGYYALLGSSRKMNDRGEWRAVINKFRIITTNRPKSARGDDAMYTTGLLYEKLYKRSRLKIDRDNAIRSFQRVIANYPKSTLVDDAQRHIGDIRFLDNDNKRASRAYRKARASSSARSAASSRHTASRAQSKDALARLTSIRRFSRDGYTRLILYVSESTAFKTETLKNPDRIFIDLLDTSASPEASRVEKYGSGMVRSVRVAQNSSSVTRVVLDLAEKNTDYTVSSLRDPFRIVIDMGRKRAPVKKRSTVARNAPTSRRRANIAANAGYSASRIRTIVIDPGHGGKDPGAIGPGRLKEKDVTLAISKKLASALKKRCGCRVALTRSDDRFLELDERTVFANSLDADLFVSVHVNASKDRRARGVETYFLSPARSKDELATAARENMLAMKSSNEEDNDLAYIMSDLSNTQKVNDSVVLARNIQRSLVKGIRASYSGVKDKGVKQAVFYVLWRASMPSALVETGFITNSREARRLGSSKYISKLAESIADGVMMYSKTYTVARAD